MLELGAVIVAAVLVTLWFSGSVSRPSNSSSDWWHWYNEYLRSPEWKLKRQAVISRAGGRCANCGKYKPIQVHHLPGSYDRIPNELPWDLDALCFDCHKLEHTHRGHALALLRQRLQYPGKRF